MSSYIYRGVEYSKSNASVDVNHQKTFMYRGISYSKRAPLPVTLDRSKICYRGSRLADAPAPEEIGSAAFFGLFSYYKLAH